MPRTARRADEPDIATPRHGRHARAPLVDRHSEFAAPTQPQSQLETLHVGFAVIAFRGIRVLLGLYVRLKIAETPAFRTAIERAERVRVPLVALLTHHSRATLAGAFAMVVCYTLFYISTVFTLSYGVSTLHIPRQTFLGMLCFAVLFMALATPIAAAASDRFGRRPVLMVGIAAAIASGFTMAPLVGSGSPLLITVFLTLELFLMGVTFAPMGALLPELFPTAVRYTGAGVAYNLGGILGASVAPYIAQMLATRGGLAWVGGYVSVAAAVSLIAVFAMRETRDVRLS